MQSKDYMVRYTYAPLSPTSTELTYYEEMSKGDLPQPFTMPILLKLKKVMEKGQYKEKLKTLLKRRDVAGQQYFSHEDAWK